MMAKWVLMGRVAKGIRARAAFWEARHPMARDAIVLGLWFLGLLAVTSLTPLGTLSFSIGGIILVDRTAIVDAGALVALGYAFLHFRRLHLRVSEEVGTEALPSMEAIIRKITLVLPKANPSLRLMANVPNVGLAGAPEHFAEYHEELIAAAKRCGVGMACIYVNPEKDIKGSGLGRFYRRRGQTEARIGEIVAGAKELDRELDQLKVRVFRKSSIHRVKTPHFILVDPNGENRAGIIWYLHEPDQRAEGGELTACGYYTRHPDIIRTYVRVFEDAITEG